LEEKSEGVRVEWLRFFFEGSMVLEN